MAQTRAAGGNQQMVKPLSVNEIGGGGGGIRTPGTVSRTAIFKYTESSDRL
jgi:hypothetical protein